MANYPTSLDTLTNPTSGDTLASPAHSTQHANANDIAEALEAKVGIGASTPTSGMVLTGTGVGSSAWAAAGGSVDRARIIGAGATSLVAPGNSIAGTSTNAYVANRTYYQPIVVEPGRTYDQISVNVTTSPGVGTCLLGIYEADDEWQPGALVIDAGTVAIATTGHKAISISESLTAGRYLLAFNATDNVTFFTVTGDTLIGRVGSAQANMINFVWKVETIASLPDPGTAWDASSTVTGANSGFHFPVLLRPT